MSGTPSVPGSPVSAGPSLRVDERRLAWITFDDPDRTVNVLTDDTMHALAARLTEVEEAVAAGAIRSLVFWSAKPRTFIAGADIGAIADIEDPAEGEAMSRFGQSVFMQIEKLRIPTVAAIHGTCLGGGTELALACRFRLLSDSERTEVGLPEVQLGILPAWGGTARLPRLVGLRAALDLLLTGDRVSAEKARRIGFGSDVFPAPLFREKVAEFARAAPDLEAGASRKARGIASRFLEDTAPGRRLILRAARRRVMDKTGGHYPAPLAILDVLRKHLGSSVDRALRAEAEAAGRLIVSSVSKNLIHVFRLRERARKDNGVPEGTMAKPVRSLGVVGAGIMGGGIAQLAAYHEIPARMKDVRHEAVTSGLRHAREIFDKAVSRRRLGPVDADRRMDLISGGLEYHGFQGMDVAIEAVVERMDVKRSVLRELEDIVGEHCILATNTSSLSVDVMAEGLERPDRFAGMHFFNPVHRMPLVEIVRGARTGDEAVATLHAFTVTLGKVPVVCRDGPGFLVNRILGPYLNEAGWLVAEGTRIEDVDAAALAFGMPMGPLRLVDEVGVDIATHAGHSLHEAFGERLALPPTLLSLAETDRLGRKNGQGLYRYDGGTEKGVDESVYEELGLPRPSRHASAEDLSDIRARLVLVMVNEAARVLEDAIVSRAGVVDLAMIMGTGFPAFRGGLLRFADTLHPRQVLSRLEDLFAKHGERFEPAPVVRELARTDRSFYEAFGG
jgi:3-hydroxyacyl-CoA dehydrogenase/enoyl-CoA hydratase/3-hydroxybutyryl-CoA epimerase